MMDFISRELNAENTVNVNQHGFTEIRFCRMNLILFDRTTNLVDKGDSCVGTLLQGM